MKSMGRILLLFLFAVSLSGCASTNTGAACDSLLSDIPQAERNTDLKISAPADLNPNFKIGSPIGLNVDNFSKNLIAVAPDNDLEIFGWQGTAWSKLANQYSYSASVDQISYKTYMGPGSAVYIAIFAIPQADKPAQVCFLVRGIEDPDGSRVKVGADVELTMVP